MKIGDANELRVVVTEDMTAAKIGSGGLPVFGTPFLLGLMENVALQLMQRELPEEKGSVGIYAELEHTAPTPVGMAVTVRAEVTEISENGKIMTFKTSAWDEAGPIGQGIHRRAVINSARFLEKCNSRKAEDKA